MSRNFKVLSRLGLEAMMSRLGLEAMMSRLGLGRFGSRSSSVHFCSGRTSFQSKWFAFSATQGQAIIRFALNVSLCKVQKNSV